MSGQDTAPTPTWKVASVVLFYMAVALVMVMTNKWVLTTSSLPQTFLLMQLVISVLLLHLLALLPIPTSSPFSFRVPRWTKATIFKMIPVCTANVVGLVFNIYCLKLVDASYFQVARGLTLPMTVVLQSLTTGEKPSGFTIISCGLVTWGFTYSFIPAPFLNSTTPIPISGSVDVVPAAPESPILSTHSEAPMLGMLLGVASAAMVAIHAVLVKQALKLVDGKTMDLAYWQNALSALALLPGIVTSGEIGGILRLFQGLEGSMRAFLIGSGVTGVVGFLICLAGLLSIKVTSPVTHMFSSAVRSVLQTMLGVYLFHDVLNANRIMSTILIILGGIVYTWHKSRQSPPPKPKESQLDNAIREKEASRPLLSTSPEVDAEKSETAGASSSRV